MEMFWKKSGMQEEEEMRWDWKRKKSVLAMILAFACLFAVIPVQTQAATKAYMSKLNVKWDLKKDKTVTYKSVYAGIGMKKQKAKITNVKVRDSSKKGYKEMTFTVKYTMKWNMKADEVHAAVNSAYFKKNKSLGGYRWYTVVDYDTGANLEGKNKHDVTVTRTQNWKYSSAKKYYDKDGCWAEIGNASIKVKIVYPASYKGLCIGVGGSTKLGGTKDDAKYWKGSVPFGKTSYFSKKDKTVAHFMRVK